MMEAGKIVTDIPLATVKGLEGQLNNALEKKDMIAAKVYKKHLVKALKDYYSI